MAQSADGVPHLVKEYKECHQQTYLIKTLVGFYQGGMSEATQSNLDTVYWMTNQPEKKQAVQ